MTLTPAYGRDYKTAKAAKADFAAGKDFIISDHFHPSDGKYVNRDQLAEEGVRSVVLRFARLSKTARVEV